MKILIIEDEPLSVLRLTELIKEIEPNVQIVFTIDSVEAGVAYFNNPPAVWPELIFMDIELGDGLSFDIFREIHIGIPVVFITAYRDHALSSFKMNSVDYLLKPLRKEELERAVQKYKRYYVQEKVNTEPDIPSLLKNIKGPGFRENKQRFLAKTGTRLISVPADQIAYFYTRDKSQYLKTNKAQDFIIDKSMDEIEESVDTRIFFRANRQFIINYRNIEKVHSWFSGKLKLQMDPESYEEIIVSRLRAGEFKRWLGE